MVPCGMRSTWSLNMLLLLHCVYNPQTLFTASTDTMRSFFAQSDHMGISTASYIVLDVMQVYWHDWH